MIQILNEKNRIDLQWPKFNVNLAMVSAWMTANASSTFLGLTGHKVLHVYFSAVPSSAVISAVNTYWAALTSASSEATSYQSAAQIAAAAKTAAQAAQSSGMAKLVALGLTQAEIQALIG